MFNIRYWFYLQEDRPNLIYVDILQKYNLSACGVPERQTTSGAAHCRSRLIGRVHTVRAIVRLWLLPSHLLYLHLVDIQYRGLPHLPRPVILLPEPFH